LAEDAIRREFALPRRNDTTGASDQGQRGWKRIGWKFSDTSDTLERLWDRGNSLSTWKPVPE
jgi:type II secretory pathway component PulJ